MRKTRALCAALACLMLAGSFTACGETNEEPVATETPTAAVTELASETEVTDDLPDTLDYGEDEVVILSTDREGWTSGEIAVERMNGDLVNDTVFERNKYVEERLNIRFNSIRENTDDCHVVVNKVSTSVKAGTHEYDLLGTACYSAVNESLNGTFADLRQTEYIDFEKPYWSQGFNEVVEYKGAQFGVTGALLLSLYRFSFATVFNKDLFTDAGIPFLYEDVKNGTWTLDRQIELTPIFHRDNGNGTQDKEGDIYGFISNSHLSTDPYWSSCMVNILRKNADGDYEFVFDSAKLHDVAEKVLRLYYETDDSMFNCLTVGQNEEQDHIRDMFADGAGAMATVRIMALESENMRNMEQKYGVVPLPKYDEQQTGYRTLMHDQFTIMCVPTTVGETRLDEMGAVLEAMGSISLKTLRPAYYETTLRTKIAQDPESAEMLDLVIDNIYIDAGIIYTSALSAFHDKFRVIIGSGKNTVVSDYKSVSNSAKRALTKMTKKLDKLVDGL